MIEIVKKQRELEKIEERQVYCKEATSSSVVAREQSADPFSDYIGEAMAFVQRLEGHEAFQWNQLLANMLVAVLQ